MCNFLNNPIGHLLGLGSPFLCRVMDPSIANSPIVPSGTAGGRLDPDSLVAVELEHLGLIQINDPSQFTIRVAGGDDAELAVSVQGLSIQDISSFYMSLFSNITHTVLRYL